MNESTDTFVFISKEMVWMTMDKFKLDLQWDFLLCTHIIHTWFHVMIFSVHDLHYWKHAHRWGQYLQAVHTKFNSWWGYSNIHHFQSLIIKMEIEFMPQNESSWSILTVQYLSKWSETFMEASDISGPHWAKPVLTLFVYFANIHSFISCIICFILKLICSFFQQRWCSVIPEFCIISKYQAWFVNLFDHFSIDVHVYFLFANPWDILWYIRYILNSHIEIYNTGCTVYIQ